jgi:GAF domain-containing protein
MSDEKKEVFGRAEEFLALFSRGAEFTKQILQENERLRMRVTEVEERQNYAAQDGAEWEKLREELLARIAGLENDKQDVLDHLRKTIIEIVINLIGAEVFAVYVLDEKSDQLSPVASEGKALSAFPRVPLGSGVVGESVESGETACGDALPSDDLERPIVCIPLRIEERPIGAIAIFKLLAQKDAFAPLDHELFTLLAGHAATSIFAAQLYGQSERKLNTIQGFIDLLTK